jgi:hypothetical protein
VLSSIDCSQHIEKKGKFSYLAWTWAWAMVKERYPEARYNLLGDIVYPDGTMEVRVEVAIPLKYLAMDDGSVEEVCTLSHTMWLPVLDYNNKPIPSPNAFDINTARMRCLVKCLAMFGLGHYIYAGESMPGPSPVLQEKFDELTSLVANDKGWELMEFYEENADHMDNLFNMAPDGKKTQYKNDVRACYRKANESMKATVGVLDQAVNDPDSGYGVSEVIEELTDLERKFVFAAMDTTLRYKVEEILREQ